MNDLLTLFLPVVVGIVVGKILYNHKVEILKLQQRIDQLEGRPKETSDDPADWWKAGQ